MAVTVGDGTPGDDSPHGQPSALSQQGGDAAGIELVFDPEGAEAEFTAARVFRAGLNERSFAL